MRLILIKIYKALIYFPATTALALLLCIVPFEILAQPHARDYPSKPVKLVIPYVAGGGIDIIARTIAQKMSTQTGHKFIVENRGGAGGSIGTDFVAKSLPDGYTILVTSSAHASLPSIMNNLNYDPIQDFSPITLVARSVGLILVVHPSLPVSSVKELIALTKANPGLYRYGSGGTGSVTHFAAESFNFMAGTEIKHVPYKGLGQAIVDCLAGHIEVCFVAATAGKPHIKSDKLRALGLTGLVRWGELPNVPTIEEAGLKNYSYPIWYAFLFPANTPSEYSEKMRNEINLALEDSETKRIFSEQGLIPVFSTSQELNKIIKEDIELHKKLVNRIGLEKQ